ncbi:hypothetical protein [Streptomyces sp. NPDC002490]|uniref:hypothetical protein n=1 Tax=Streptomyces sp. NPDC002490 TaxID=3154416 RepID=UPI00332677D7
MNHLAGRAWLEQDELYAIARESDALGRAIVVPSSPVDLPDLVTASQQLCALSGLVNGLADEVQSRASDHDSGLDLRPVISGYTAAAVHAGRALAHFTETYRRLGFLHHSPQAPGSGSLRYASQAEFRSIQDGLQHVHNSLGSVGRELRGCTDGIGTTPLRVLAALHRSVPATSIYRTPPPSPTLVPRHPNPPEPRRAR